MNAIYRKMPLRLVPAAVVAAACMVAGCDTGDEYASTDTDRSPNAVRAGGAGSDAPTAAGEAAGMTVQPRGDAQKQWNEPPAMTIDTAKTYHATIKTNQGDIRLELFDDAAPKTVNNFVFLAREDFYDGTIFHRVINDFMIQGGDPTGTGTGGPGYRFEDETCGNPHKHEPFTLSMANAGPNTNGSQFFITERATAHLDGRHTVFGRVVEGQDVVQKITDVQTDARDRPVQEVRIEDVVIEEQEGAPTTRPAGE